MAIVEEYFPRGSKTKTDKKEVKKWEKKKKPENLFASTKHGSIKKKKKVAKPRQSKEEEEDLVDVKHKSRKAKKSEEKMKEAVTVIERLAYKMLSEGMHVLCKVHDIRDMHAIVCLPGRIQAVVPITNISTPYSELLQKLADDKEVDIRGLRDILTVGDVFPCTIKEVTNDGSYKVTASLNPADVSSDIPISALSKGMRLTAAVKSVEDHGFLMDIGIAGARSFMTKEPKLDLSVGQIVQVTVTDCKVDGHVATVTVSTASAVKFKQNQDLNVATLIPGTKLHVHVKKATTFGLVVTFGNLIGYIHKDHLVAPFDDPLSYVSAASTTAVVLYTIPLVNDVYLSLKPTLVDPETNKESKVVKLGSIFNQAVVVETTCGGLFLQLDKQTKGFAPLKHLSDKQVDFDELKLTHPVKSQKRCRILNYASLDDVYICTMKKSLIAQKALRYEDFTIGESVEAKVESVIANGVVVRLGANLEGFVPKLHWADDPRLKKPELRFKQGDTIVCRVLNVLPEKKTLHLTCKKSLVGSDGPVYEEPSQLETNTKLKGTVALINKNGALVSFYGDLTGWIPASRLTKKGVLDVARYFYAGQLIDCIVESVSATGKVVLNWDSGNGPTTVTGPVEKTLEKSDSALGHVVECRVERILPADKDAGGGLEVYVPSLKIKGLIPTEHLSDFPSVCSSLLDTFIKGDNIAEAAIWIPSKLQTILTLKRSIISFAKEQKFPTSPNEAVPGLIVPCVTSRNTNFGVFATFLCPPSTCEVLFPKSKMSDELQSALKKDLKHVTLEGKIESLANEEKKKIVVSALPKDVPPKPVETLDAYFQELERIRTAALASEDVKLKNMAGMKLGDSVMGKLPTAFSPGADLEFELSNGLKCVVPAYHCDSKTFKKDDLVVGCVLFCDLVRQTVYTTIRSDVIAHIAAVKRQKGTVSLNSKLIAKVLLHLDHFTMVAVHGAVRDVAFVSNVRNVNEAVAPPACRYTLGECVSILISTSGKIATACQRGKKKISDLNQPTQAGDEDDGPPEKKRKTERVPKEPKKEMKPTASEKKSEQPSPSVGGPSDATSSAGAASVAEPKEIDEQSKATAKKADKKAAKAVQRSDDRGDASPAKKSRPNSTAKPPGLSLPRLVVSKAFKWDDDATTAHEPSGAPESSDDEETPTEKVAIKDRRERARQKLEQARQDEAKLSAIEESLNDPERAPTTADDFDRMVLASPNSSILWVQYMAFHLENAEIEKARTVAQRALKIISFREEQEKFNVWIGWLNLESMYGTTDSYEETFQEALRYNEPLKVYRQMALNMEQNDKSNEAESLHTTMMKKFKKDKSVWLDACRFYVRNSKLDTARNVFQRALTVVDKKDHIDLISRFAQLEVKCGEIEKGKTRFDTLMMSYPKRTDLWIVYVDTLTKAGDVESARQVLERCIMLQLPAKKMKTIFSKFLEFETHHGDEERQEYVRQKALEYVESKNEPAE